MQNNTYSVYWVDDGVTALTSTLVFVTCADRVIAMPPCSIATLLKWHDVTISADRVEHIGNVSACGKAAILAITGKSVFRGKRNEVFRLVRHFASIPLLDYTDYNNIVPGSLMHTPLPVYAPAHLLHSSLAHKAVVRRNLTRQDIEVLSSFDAITVTPLPKMSDAVMALLDGALAESVIKTSAEATAVANQLAKLTKAPDFSSEEAAVMAHINRMYVVTSVPQDTINAVHILNGLEHELRVPLDERYAFHQRVAGYLEKAGLCSHTADGVFYSGIRPAESYYREKLAEVQGKLPCATDDAFWRCDDIWLPVAEGSQYEEEVDWASILLDDECRGADWYGVVNDALATADDKPRR